MVKILSTTLTKETEVQLAPLSTKNIFFLFLAFKFGQCNKCAKRLLIFSFLKK